MHFYPSQAFHRESGVHFAVTGVPPDELISQEMLNPHHTAHDRPRSNGGTLQTLRIEAKASATLMRTKEHGPGAAAISVGADVTRISGRIAQSRGSEALNRKMPVIDTASYAPRVAAKGSHKVDFDTFMAPARWREEINRCGNRERSRGTIL